MQPDLLLTYPNLLLTYSNMLLQTDGTAAAWPMMHQLWLIYPFMHSEKLEDQQVWLLALKLEPIVLHLFSFCRVSAVDVLTMWMLLCVLLMLQRLLADVRQSGATDDQGL